MKNIIFPLLLSFFIFENCEAGLTQTYTRKIRASDYADYAVWNFHTIIMEVYNLAKTGKIKAWQDEHLKNTYSLAQVNDRGCYLYSYDIYDPDNDQVIPLKMLRKPEQQPECITFNVLKNKGNPWCLAMVFHYPDSQSVLFYLAYKDIQKHLSKPENVFIEGYFNYENIKPQPQAEDGANLAMDTTNIKLYSLHQYQVYVDALYQGTTTGNIKLYQNDSMNARWTREECLKRFSVTDSVEEEGKFVQKTYSLPVSDISGIIVAEDYTESKTGDIVIHKTGIGLMMAVRRDGVMLGEMPWFFNRYDEFIKFYGSINPSNTFAGKFFSGVILFQTASKLSVNSLNE